MCSTAQESAARELLFAGWRTRCEPQGLREQYKKQLKDLQEDYGGAMLEIRARKNSRSLLGEDEK
jgi:hypothetical protein